VKLHTVFITHNRLELTKRTIESYLATVDVELHTYVVVDNASTDGTQRWLRAAFDSPVDHAHEPFLLEENRYPGYATNLGWRVHPHDCTHLHRSDNDWEFLPGWCEEVERKFSENERLGQLGLRTDEQEMHNAHNVGGNCIIRRELWDAGLRYKETPWPQLKTPGYTEDSYMSPAVLRMGWEWDRVDRKCIEGISFEDPEDPYYQKTWRDRGIYAHLWNDRTGS
jgi:glycosyltransferase involved in cell wall biosynthesis